MRTIFHISRRSVALLLYGVLFAVLLFFALTRTQVGRDGLRMQLERQFEADFAGRLKIGRLTGNLVYDLFAKDVALYDPDGRLVLSADSVLIEPSWRDLLQQRVSLSNLTLIKPVLHLVRDADGAWNLAASVRRRQPAQPVASPWSFTSADLRVIDGVIRTSSLGAPPEAVARGLVFNYADTQIDAIDARATVEWTPDLKLVDLLRFEGQWTALGLPVHSLQGQAVLEANRLSLNRLTLRAGETQLALTGAVDNLEALRAGTPEAAHLSLDLQPSRLDHAELRRVLPTLPLADAMAVTARVQGPLDALVFEHLELERGQTRLTGEGTLRGLPRKLDFDVSLSESIFAARDLEALLPDVALPDLRHLGRLRVALTATGVVPVDTTEAAPLQATSRLLVRGEAGRVSGTVGLRRAADTLVAYTADLQAERLDLGLVMKNPALRSRLNGRLSVRGQGLTLDDATTELGLRLAPSHFAGRYIDSLAAEGTTRGRHLSARAFLDEGRGGMLFASGTLHLDPQVPAYAFDLDARSLDLGRLLLNDTLETRLNAQLQVDGRGTSWNALQGTARVAFASSEVRVGDSRRTILPHETVLTLSAPGSGAPRITLGGDLATVTVDGEAALEPLVALGRLWGDALARAIGREFDKPYPRSRWLPASFTLFGGPDEAPSHEPYRIALRKRLLEAGLDTSLTLTAEVALHRPELLTAFVPTLPRFDAKLRASLHITAGADRFALDGTVATDSLRSGGIRTGALRADLRASGSLEAPLEETLFLALDARTDTLHLGGQALRGPSLAVRYQRHGGQISLTSQQHGQTGPLRVAATLDLLPDRNRFTVSDFYLAAAGYEWTVPEDHPVDLYADAIVIPGLTLESRTPGASLVQRLRLHGVLSSTPTDTVYLDAENIGLRQLSEMTALKRPLGGLLDGRLALTGGLQHPELTGRIEVPSLTFDNRLVGRLTATSQYEPGTPDVLLSAALVPAPEDEELLPAVHGTAPPIVEESRLRMNGTFRLPGAELNGGRTRPGTMDLRLEADRLDFFFFEYLFPTIVSDVEGYAAGRGSITGTFDHPVFEAQIQARDVRFEVPRFNLAYEGEGPVTIDRDGITLHDVSVRDRTGGSARLNGSILFNEYRYFSFDLAAQLQDLQIINVLNSRDLAFYGQIWASGNATLTGPLHNALLRSADAVTHSRSEIFIPLTETGTTVDPGFIIFADSSGQIPDLNRLVRRANLLAKRPVGEREFLDGLEMDLNIFAPQGSTVHLVIDPLLGDVINAVGTGRIQLQRTEGEFFTYGTLDVGAGDYLFTAGDLFFRRFLIDQGTISWDGDPTDAQLAISASYRTRASRAGLPGNETGLIPLIVRLDISGRVSTPGIDLRLEIDRRNRELISNAEGLEATLNQPERTTEYATSVLLTNSFLLTTDFASASGSERANTRNQFAFNSLSQLVTSQINRYLSQALPNFDFNFGVQGERAQDLDVTYGVALRLLDERLIIRGQGIYQSDRADHNRGEFIVEVRLSPTVSVEAFYRHEGDVLTEEMLTKTTGVGLYYQTQFSTWRRLVDRLFGWALPNRTTVPALEDEPVAGTAADG